MPKGRNRTYTTPAKSWTWGEGAGGGYVGHSSARPRSRSRRPAQRTGCRCSPLNSPLLLPCTLAHFLRGLRGAPAFKGSLRSPSTCLHLNFSLATLAFSNIITDYEWVKFRIKKKKKPRPQTFQNSQNSFNHSVRFRFKGSAQPSNLGPDVDRTPLPMVASDKKRTEIKRHLK